jgi:urease accessory protein
LRLQTEQMGKSLQVWGRAVGWGGAACRGSPSGSPTTYGEGEASTYPVAFACAAAATAASPRHAALTFAFGWAENMMQAAIKAVPLGQSAGQRILARLAAQIPHAVDAASALRDDERQSFTPMLAILSAQHEIQYSRLFRS